MSVLPVIKLVRNYFDMEKIRAFYAIHGRISRFLRCVWSEICDFFLGRSFVETRVFRAIFYQISYFSRIPLTTFA